MGCKGSRVRIPPPRPKETSKKPSLRTRLFALLRPETALVAVGGEGLSQDGSCLLQKIKGTYLDEASLCGIVLVLCDLVWCILHIEAKGAVPRVLPCWKSSLLAWGCFLASLLRQSLRGRFWRLCVERSWIMNPLAWWMDYCVGAVETSVSRLELWSLLLLKSQIETANRADQASS